MWLFPGFGLFVGILPFLFIFLVLNLARSALRETRGGRPPSRGWHRWPGRTAAAPSRDGRTDERRVNRVFRLAYRLGGRLTVSDLVSTSTSASMRRNSFWANWSTARG